MASTINADNGVVSGITGIRTTADSTGNLALQTNGVTLLTVNTANTVAVASGGLSISGATSGAITLVANATAGTNTLTLPNNTGIAITTGSSNVVTQTMLSTGVASNGPAFSAYASSDLNVTDAVITKVQCNTEEFDTASCYDNTTNYRFTPNVAGYYQVTVQVYYNTNGNKPVSFYNLIYKNGAAVKTNFLYATTTILLGQAPLTALIYMNGTTDYLEFYARASGGSSMFFGSGAVNTFFQAFLARSA